VSSIKKILKKGPNIIETYTVTMYRVPARKRRTDIGMSLTLIHRNILNIVKIVLISDKDFFGEIRHNTTTSQLLSELYLIVKILRKTNGVKIRKKRGKKIASFSNGSKHVKIYLRNTSKSRGKYTHTGFRFDEGRRLPKFNFRFSSFPRL